MSLYVYKCLVSGHVALLRYSPQDCMLAVRDMSVQRCRRRRCMITALYIPVPVPLALGHGHNSFLKSMHV